MIYLVSFNETRRYYDYNTVGVCVRFRAGNIGHR
jgi:hypothetical protein